MTALIPTTTVTIQRGTAEENTFGDVLPALTTVQTGVPAAVSERTSSSAMATQPRCGGVMPSQLSSRITVRPDLLAATR